MDSQNIYNLVNTFVSSPRAFCIVDIMDFIYKDVEEEKTLEIQRMLERAILKDERFITLDDRASGTRYYISAEALFRWFIGVTIRLAKAGQTRLSERQLAIGLSTLRKDGKFRNPPIGAICFGCGYGFVGSSSFTGIYVFPLAGFLSSFKRRKLEIAIEILQDLAVKEYREFFLGRSIDYWIDRGFVLFKARQRIRRTNHNYIRMIAFVKLREGLSPSGRVESLSDIGAKWGGRKYALSRERTRQIIKKFWNLVNMHPNYNAMFIKGIIVEIIKNKGSLVFSTKSLKIDFLAKCANKEILKVPYTDFYLLCDKEKNLTNSIEGLKWHILIDSNHLRVLLHKNIDVYLSYHDMKLICDEIAINAYMNAKTFQKLYLTLKYIGRPAHYLEIAEEFGRLFPEDGDNIEALHASLINSCRRLGVVWVGAKGTFALKEWGYKRPGSNWFTTVTGIVNEFFEKTGKPVPFSVISAEVQKRRKYFKDTSLKIAVYSNNDILNLGNDSFIPKIKWIDQNTFDDEKLDEILRKFKNSD